MKPSSLVIALAFFATGDAFSADKQDVELKPAGDKFEAKGTLKVSGGAMAVAQVNIGGKSITARFVLK